MSDGPACFGFFGGSSNAACQVCVASRRCKAILISDGFDIVSAMIAQLSYTLPDAPFRNTDRLSEMVKQLKNPPTTALTPEEQSLLDAVAVSESIPGSSPDVPADIDIG